MSRIDGAVWDLFLELKNQLKALESRLTDLEDRVTENGG